LEGRDLKQKTKVQKEGTSPPQMSPQSPKGGPKEGEGNEGRDHEKHGEILKKRGGDSRGVSAWPTSADIGRLRGRNPADAHRIAAGRKA